jgi:hypothetical protein
VKDERRFLDTRESVRDRVKNSERIFEILLNRFASGKRNYIKLDQTRTNVLVGRIQLGNQVIVLNGHLVKVRIQEPRNELKLGGDSVFDPRGEDGLECLRLRVRGQRVLRSRVRTLGALDLGFEAKERRVAGGLFLFLPLAAGNGGGTSRDISKSFVELSDFLRKILVEGI